MTLQNVYTTGMPHISRPPRRRQPTHTNYYLSFCRQLRTRSTRLVLYWALAHYKKPNSPGLFGT
jgi:hypothetical protein